jgi:hypothetical protein
MTPDQHAQLAEGMILVADAVYRERFDNVSENEVDPKDCMYIQTLTGLAQVHAILSLHRLTPPALAAGTDTGAYTDALAAGFGLDKLPDRIQTAGRPSPPDQTGIPADDPSRGR